jgi:hypothetical protein
MVSCWSELYQASSKLPNGTDTRSGNSRKKAVNNKNPPWIASATNNVGHSSRCLAGRRFVGTGAAGARAEPG